MQLKLSELTGGWLAGWLGERLSKQRKRGVGRTGATALLKTIGCSQ